MINVIFVEMVIYFVQESMMKWKEQKNSIYFQQNALMQPCLHMNKCAIICVIVYILFNCACPLLTF